MIESGSSRDVPSESSGPIGVAPLESIVCTQELRNRPLRSPEYEKETRAFEALASALADSPRTILQTLADKVFEVLNADSAGLSLLTKEENRFYWAAVAGAWRPHIGATAPRNCAPCGDVLDHNTPMLFNHWERRYPQLSWAMPLADEGLLVPFYVNGKAVGTIWAIAHNSGRKFDAEDLRLLESMSRFASAAYQAVESIETLKFEIAAREKAETALQDLTDGLEIQVRIRTEELEQRNKEVKQLQEQLFNENIVLRQEIDKTSMFEEIVGSSEALRKVLLQVAKVAPTHSTVLITGETGTGKELIARAIHKRSPRSSCAFVSVNCAGIPSSLMASELFGHEKGAFTGAVQRRQGRFELADGGTIFLDEIGELSIETQVMLLRVLQEHEFERVGRSGPIRTDVRVIAATNRDLEVAIADGTFRADLFYRLNVFPLEVPALHERRMDIPLLVEYFIHRYAKRAGKRIRGISQETLTLLQSYDWPGNIRELQNVIERAVILSDSNTLSIDKQWFSGRPLRPPAVSGAQTGELATVGREAVKVALRQSKGRVAGPFGAATRLGVPPSTLESKIKALKLDKRLYKSE
jgi:transcriptional regulator with GAF, ATPase, and Fis domain